MTTQVVFGGYFYCILIRNEFTKKKHLENNTVLIQVFANWLRMSLTIDFSKHFSGFLIKNIKKYLWKSFLNHDTLAASAPIFFYNQTMLCFYMVGSYHSISVLDLYTDFCMQIKYSMVVHPALPD